MIAGVIVLYNPPETVIDNISSYLPYLEKLYIVDNSTIFNSTLTYKLKELPKVEYITEQKNLGIARALNIGCENAIKNDYKWVLTMDQDSIFTDASFFDIVSTSKIENAGIYAASYTTKYDRWVKNFNEDFNEIHFVVTSGNLVNLNLWKQVGGFEEKLFIDEVDHDFCAKVNLVGYKILTTKKIFMSHNVGETIGNTSDKVFQGHNPIRYYYITRNMLFITKKYIFSDPKLVLNRWKHNIKNYIKIAFFYPEKSLYFATICNGIRDFFKGKYGEMLRK